MPCGDGDGLFEDVLGKASAEGEKNVLACWHIDKGQISAGLERAAVTCLEMNGNYLNLSQQVSPSVNGDCIKLMHHLCAALSLPEFTSSGSDGCQVLLITHGRDTASSTARVWMWAKKRNLG